jgi:hypothetical protein
MIEIRLLDYKAAAAVCADAGASFKAGMLVYEASEGGEAAGDCIFGIEAGEGRLYGVPMKGGGQLPIADGLVRSALSLMYQRGVADVVCCGAVDQGLLLGAGFRPDGEVWKARLKESFFSGCDK